MIGIFDSGVGGLSVFCELVREYPKLKTVYFADSANFPYGEKSQSQLLTITERATETLVSQGATTVVVACNSATVSTIEHLRERYPQIRFVGVEPAIKVAVETAQDNIGLLATKITVKTHNSDKLAPGVSVYKQHDGRLIDMIENSYDQIGKVELEEALKPLLDKGVRTVVLGCSHFYFLRDKFQQYYPGLTFIEPAAAVAARALEIEPTIELGDKEFLVSGDVTKFTRFLENVVGYKNANVRKA